MSAFLRFGATGLRALQLIASVIVLALLARYLDVLPTTHFWGSSRVKYGLAVSVISLVFSLAFLAPFGYQFYGFALDFILFILWIVAFGLFARLSGKCESLWYRSVWRAWDTKHQCGKWRTVLGFSFIAAFLWLITAILGAYYLHRRRRDATFGEKYVPPVTMHHSHRVAHGRGTAPDHHHHTTAPDHTHNHTTNPVV